MIIPVRNLVDRVRQPKSRADELIELRRRFDRAAGEEPDDEQLELARELRSLRGQISAALGGVSACGTCTKGVDYPPEGTFDGGHCCSGNTDYVFSDEEVASLAFAGTRARHLRAPTTEHAGCAFRGELGCTLTAEDRPNVCTRYMCRDLRRELFERGDVMAVQHLVDQLEDRYARFFATRR